MNNKLEIKDPPLRLSQGQLNLLETCPPKFQQVYLEQLISPLSPEEQEKQMWGSQFHLLMQQRELGLPIDSLLQSDRQLQNSLNALVKAVPEIFAFSSETCREAEHYRTLDFQGYLLTVVYDLLIANSYQAQILDWKTYLQPANPVKLSRDWQTRLYLYILAETSDYSPEQISLTYWFVKLPQKPQSLTFKYDRQKHESTRQDLTRLLTQLDRWLCTYLHQGIALPHRINCQESCPYYQSLLNHQKLSAATANILDIDCYSAIAEIEEVSL